MKRYTAAALSLVFALLLTACGQGENMQPATTPKSQTAAEISWFDGSVSEAFALAKARDQPLFLYWGAVWCPPCNQLRSTVFKDPAFIKTTRAYIAVYLDGDSEGAQRWGEHFGAIGYPTLIVFGPQGEERTRLTSGMALERYPQALHSALSQTTGLRRLLDAALAKPRDVSDEQWNLLAHTAWEADDGRLLGPDKAGETLAKLATYCPDASAAPCRRLRLLSGIANTDDDLSPTDIENLRRILQNPQLSHDNLSELQYYGVTLSAAAPPERRAELRKALQALADRSFEDASLPLKSRMLATRLHMDLRRDDDGELPQDDDALQTLVRERAAWADKAATTPVERQSLIYNAAWYLHEVGLSDDAVTMLRTELENSVAPYYYMSYLADIEKARDNAALSLGWSARAWQLANGPATRTQWGVQHVFNLIALAPDQVQTLETVINQLLDGVEQSNDGYYQRTRMRMQRLYDALQDWADDDSEQRSETAKRLRQRISALCQQSDTDCSAFSDEA